MRISEIKIKVINIFNPLLIIGLSFVTENIITQKYPAMIIKLPIPFLYARQKAEKVVRPITRSERIKFDRYVMVMMIVLAIAGAILFA